MTITYKSKKGFTLLEMMLSIAIVTIVSGCLVSLMIGIKDSYISTYNSDDSADYAMLYARGLENSVLSKVQDYGTSKTVSSATWNIGTDASTGQKTLLCNGSALFSLNQMKVTPRGQTAAIDKWDIQLTFDSNINITKNNLGPTNGMIKYTIKVFDNYTNPGTLKCTYEGGFFLPHFDNGEIKTTNSGSTLQFTHKP